MLSEEFGADIIVSDRENVNIDLKQINIKPVAGDENIVLSAA